MQQPTAETAEQMKKETDCSWAFVLNRGNETIRSKIDFPTVCGGCRLWSVIVVKIKHNLSGQETAGSFCLVM